MTYEAQWVDDDATARAVVADALATDVYALDTEFETGRHYATTLALVQLAWGRRVALLDPLTVDLTVLRPLFASPALALVHAGDADLPLLAAHVGALPSRLFDTQCAARLLGMATPSLAALARRFSITLDKAQQRRIWTDRPLPAAALTYAADDVAYLEHFYQRLDALLTAQGRQAWAHEEGARALEVGHQPPDTDPTHAWWRIENAAALTPPEQLVVQRLAAAREDIARRRNCPPPHVTSDADLLTLARVRSRRRPARLAALDVAARTELLAALDPPVTSAELAPLPGATYRPADAPAATILLAVADAIARTHEIDRSLLVTHKDLAALMQGFPSRLDDGWRHELFTVPAIGILEGRSSVMCARGSVTIVDAVTPTVARDSTPHRRP
jgi:ribonuclease D